MRPRKGDPDYGPTCRCGGTKALQAHTCQPCHGRIRGYKQPVDVGRTLTPRERRDALHVELERSEGELRKLIEQQFYDDRRRIDNQGNGVLSFDVPDRFGHTLHDKVAA